MSIAEALFIVYEGVLLASAVIALLNLKWLKSRGLALFAPYLCYVFVQELLMHHFYALFFVKQSNDVVYNIYRLVTVLFFSALYYRLPFMNPLRKYIASLAVIYTLAFLVTFIFFQSIFEYNGYLGLVRGFVITVAGLLFLFSYFHLDNRAQEKFWSPWLWVTIAVVIFYPVVSISQTFVKHLYDLDATIYGIRLYNLIPQLMSIFMYSCFGYAFYLCKKRK